MKCKIFTSITVLNDQLYHNIRMKIILKVQWVNLIPAINYFVIIAIRFNSEFTGMPENIKDRIYLSSKNRGKFLSLIVTVVIEY